MSPAEPETVSLADGAGNTAIGCYDCSQSTPSAARSSSDNPAHEDPQGYKALHARPRRRARGRQRCRCPGDLAAHGAPRRGARLPPLLGGRAPQHGRRGQFRHGGAGRHIAGGTLAHPRRLGRRDAAQPCAAGGGRAVRHPGRRCTPDASTSASAARRVPTAHDARPAPRPTPGEEDEFPRNVVELQMPTSTSASRISR
jgi:hypothetical protein